MVKKGVKFTTNLGFEATKDSLLKSGIAIGDGQDSKGRLHFYLSGLKDYTIQVTKKGVLMIWYPEEVNFELVLDKALPLLMKADGTPATIIEGPIEIRKPYQKKNINPIAVETTVKKLRFCLMRNPTIKEVAYEVGKPPETIRSEMYSLSPKIGWKEPNPDEIKEAKNFVAEIYEIAALMDYFPFEAINKRPTRFLGGQSWKKVEERALYAVENETDQIPKLELLKEDEKTIEFKFIPPPKSKYNFGSLPESYDKEKRLINGQFGSFFHNMKVIGNQVMKQLNIDNHEDSSSD